MKPISGEELELLLEFLGMSLYNISLLLSSLLIFVLSAENICMLNGKMSFDIPNVPADHVLLRFNILFAFVFEVVSGGKDMMILKIDPPKTHSN